MKVTLYSPLAFPSTEGFIVASKVRLSVGSKLEPLSEPRLRVYVVYAVSLCICTCGFNTFNLSEFFTYPNPKFFFLPKGVRITEDLLYAGIRINTLLLYRLGVVDPQVCKWSSWQMIPALLCMSFLICFLGLKNLCVHT